MSDNFKVTTIDDVKIIRLLGNLIYNTWMNELITFTDDSIQQNNFNFIIDLEDVELINSSGISMMVTILTKARRSGGDVVLCNVNSKVEKLLLITKLNTIFNTKETLEEAKLHFQATE